MMTRIEMTVVTIVLAIMFAVAGIDIQNQIHDYNQMSIRVEENLKKQTEYWYGVADQYDQMTAELMDRYYNR